MDHITYLLGAGASAKCLPVVQDLPASLNQIIIELDSSQYALTGYFPSIIGQSRTDLKNIMIEDFRWLYKEIGRHASIDTYAKQLHLKGDENKLHKLKFTTSAYFSLIQIFKRPDLRYDAFLASILNKNEPFPHFIKILSWNYDDQFEIAYSGFTDSQNIIQNRKLLNTKPKFDKIRSMTSGFGIFKLNGTIGFEDNDGNYHSFLKSYSPDFEISMLEKIVYNYISGVYPTIAGHPEPVSSMSFAWEDTEENQDNMFEMLKHSIKDTNILIIVGYSFPFFNRKIDRDILNGMPNLRKIYYQALEPEDVLKSRIVNTYGGDIGRFSFLKVNDLTQFFIPPEL